MRMMKVRTETEENVEKGEGEDAFRVQKKAAVDFRLPKYFGHVCYRSWCQSRNVSSSEALGPHLSSGELK